MTDDEMIEKMARAMWIEAGCDKHADFDKPTPPSTTAGVYRLARVAFGAIRQPLVAFDDVRAEFQKPQFMTMSSGNGKSSVEFTFHGDDRFKRACDLHNAFIALAHAFGADKPEIVS